MPEAESTFSADDQIAVIESTKAANDIYAPLSGTVIEVNEKLEADPKLVNQDPEGEAWLVKLKIDDASEFDELLDDKAYAEIVDEAKKNEEK